MEQKTLHLTLSKVDGPLFNGPILSVTLPGADGEMTLLPDHEALISFLRPGVITVRTTQEEQQFQVESGTLEISDNQVTVLL